MNVIQPRVAIISVGKQNRYGHPHKEVIERFEKMGSAIWRTDKQGAISYVFKGKMEHLKVKSHMIKHIIDEKEDCHEVAVFKTDKFNNSCNDEKCCEKPNETINPTLNQ